MKKSQNRIVVGVDFGGTWIRVLAKRAKTGKILFIKTSAPKLSHLPQFLEKLFKQWRIAPSALVIGAKGVWFPEKKAALKKRLDKLAKNVVVLSDIELAYESAFGRSLGILILAGTGSIAYGKDQQRNFARAGGLGPEKGDEGSGYWIGKKWIKQKQEKNLKDVKAIASLAPDVISKAEARASRAKKIIDSAVIHLSNLVLDVAGQLGFKKEIRVSWAGGLFQNSFFRREFFKALRTRSGKKKIVICRPKKEAVLAALEKD